jgi:hypothetical protein
MRAVVDTNILLRALMKSLGGVGPVLLRLRRGDYSCFIPNSCWKNSLTSSTST